MITIPVANPHADLLPVREELLACFATVLDSGSYILGPQVEAFETEWASFCGTAYAVGLSSGTDALALALRAVGVGPGDEVLVPAMTALATWMAVSQIGAIPVGVDIEPRRRTMDPQAAKERLNERTRAIVAVHLYGQPADVDALAEVASDAQVPLVEDAAQAHGARVGDRPVGSLGHVAAFSFYPTKNLGAVGDAGAVTTDDADIADEVRRLRQYGWRSRADSEVMGVNARLDEVQAAILRVLLPRLEAQTARRRDIALRYLDALADVPDLALPEEAQGTDPVWHVFAACHPHRDLVMRELAARGIGTTVHYAPAPPRTSVFDPSAPSFHVAERHAATTFSLPLYPALTDEQVDRVATGVREVCCAISADRL